MFPLSPSHGLVLGALGVLLAAHAAGAQDHHHMGHQDLPQQDSAQQSEHADPSGAMMHGFYGPYSMSRESSGTSWQPETTPMGGMHLMSGEWMLMVHGYADAVYTNQSGHRGDEDFYGPNMIMAMASRQVGPGTFGIRTMLSLEPATIGTNGYPELLQTGETANGRTSLIDRQHPHDLFMELAVSYSVPIQEDSAVFAYFGLPGEPALGPPTFMHRFSGMDNPEAPITHHWLDSTHISFGVATLGYIWRQVKVDASAFTGREPDQHRWDIEAPRMDSGTARLSWNPTREWATQVSYGNIHSPEQLHANVDTQRITASLVYGHTWENLHWQTTLAWGENINSPGRTLDAALLESGLRWRDLHTVFARAESVEKDELFPEGHPNDGKRYLVHKLSLGYIYDFVDWHGLHAGIGALGSIHILPAALDTFYSDTPLAFSLLTRVRL